MLIAFTWMQMYLINSRQVSLMHSCIQEGQHYSYKIQTEILSSQTIMVECLFANCIEPGQQKAAIIFSKKKKAAINCGEVQRLWKSQFLLLRF